MPVRNMQKVINLKNNMVHASVHEHQLHSSALCGLIIVFFQERTLQKFLRKWNFLRPHQLKWKAQSEHERGLLWHHLQPLPLKVAWVCLLYSSFRRQKRSPLLQCVSGLAWAPLPNSLLGNFIFQRVPKAWAWPAATARTLWYLSAWSGHSGSLSLSQDWDHGLQHLRLWHTASPQCLQKIRSSKE